MGKFIEYVLIKIIRSILKNRIYTTFTILFFVVTIFKNFIFFILFYFIKEFSFTLFIESVIKNIYFCFILLFFM